MTQEEIDNLNQPITSKDIELVIRKTSQKKSPSSDGFIMNSIKNLSRRMIIFNKTFRKKQKRTLLTLSIRPVLLDKDITRKLQSNIFYKYEH